MSAFGGKADIDNLARIDGPKFVPAFLNRPFKFDSCNCQPWFRVVSQKQRRSNHANLRENRCDIRCYWRNRGQRHCTSRSLVPSSLLPSSPLWLPSSLLPSSLLRLLSSLSPSPSLRLVSLLKEGTLRPPQPAAFSFVGLATSQIVLRQLCDVGRDPPRLIFASTSPRKKNCSVSSAWIR